MRSYFNNNIILPLWFVNSFIILSMLYFLKLDEPDTQDTAGELGTNSYVTYSSGPLHMDEQRQDDQLEPTYNSSVSIEDVTLRTCRMQWTIEKGGGRESRISVLMTRHDDDDFLYKRISLRLTIVLVSICHLPCSVVSGWTLCKCRSTWALSNTHYL